MQKTNIQRIRDSNEYDLLIKIQQKLLSEFSQHCVLDYISDKHQVCAYKTCEECIQHWMYKKE